MPMPHRRRRRVFTGYKAATLATMVDLLERAGGSGVDRDELEGELLGAIYSAGLAHDGSEFSRICEEFSVDEPGPKEFASVFSTAAAAENPLAPEVLPRSPLDYVSQLNCLLHARWLSAWSKKGCSRGPRVRTICWDALDGIEREDLRAMLRELAARAKSAITRGRPKARDLDTVLPEIAEIFLRHSRRDRHGWPDLEIGAETIFVRFLECALAGTATVNETTREALARRWERLVRAERACLRQMHREWADIAGTTED